MMNNNIESERYWKTVQKKNAPDAQKNPLTLNRFLIIKPAQKKNSIVGSISYASHIRYVSTICKFAIYWKAPMGYKINHFDFQRSQHQHNVFIGDCSNVVMFEL